MINTVGASALSAYKTDYDKTAATKQPKKDIVPDEAYHLSLSTESLEASAVTSGSAEIEDIRQQADMTTAALRDLVEKLISRQSGDTSAISLSTKFFAASGTETMSQAEAQEAVGDGGDWGVEAVSDRIVNFAKAVSGGDTSKLETLREAIDKGFANAKKTLGGSLPDISSQTYDAVMQKLDDWASTTETTVSN
ncbi:hypothetical protein IZU99_09980 [Oscillospiraceae bacterium CM]|nr:hypothetical protein IZU99_09980 [Oscillospiraceae bacterium CM]